MGSALTRLVRSLGEGARELSQEEFHLAVQDLRRLLVSELKRRGLWTSPPAFVGIIGRPTWAYAEAETDALDELASKCLDEAILPRRASLLRQAETKPEIDGLVRLNIRHFLLDAQRRNDPLGFRLFEVVQKTVEPGSRLAPN